MKKRAFVLVEILIALMLIGLFLFPLLRSPSAYFIKMKDELIQLELQRKSEDLFIQVREKFPEKHPWSSLISADKSKCHSLNGPIEIKLKGFGKSTYYPHYHLYHRQRNPKDNLMIWCVFCFKKSPKEECSWKTHEDKKYTFKFFLKK